MGNFEQFNHFLALWLSDEYHTGLLDLKNTFLSQKIIKNKIFHTENTVTNRFFNYKENGIKNFELAQKLIGLISNVI